MLGKEFENYEIRLQRLKEESFESFEKAENIFKRDYEQTLSKIFPRDILWAKKSIGGFFISEYGEKLFHGQSVSSQAIFETSVEKVVGILPLSSLRKERLVQNIKNISSFSEAQEQYFSHQDTISGDPFFALIEDFSLDGEISREEYLLLEQSFSEKQNFLKALDILPERIQKLFLAHIQLSLDSNFSEKQKSFQSEYHQELSFLQKKGISIEPVMVFVSQNYYKTPGKYRKYEHPKRRLRRTFKLALLRLLRLKLWNIDAQNILEKFEQGEWFEDYFMIIFKLLEVLDENPDNKEIYQVLTQEQEIQDDILTAEETKQKILEWDFLITKIASLFASGDAKDEENKLDGEVLDRFLDQTTDVVGDEIYFNRDTRSMAWIFSSTQEDKQEDEEDDFRNMSPETAYEMLKKDFSELEQQKTAAFAAGNYDEIDSINKKLLIVQVRLEKLVKVLFWDNDDI